MTPLASANSRKYRSTSIVDRLTPRQRAFIHCYDRDNPAINVAAVCLAEFGLLPSELNRTGARWFIQHLTTIPHNKQKEISYARY